MHDSANRFVLESANTDMPLSTLECMSACVCA